MENELMPCPVCGGGVTQPGNSDVYCVDCNYKNHVGDHNTLARRAEIGRIVEALFATATEPDIHIGLINEADGGFNAIQSRYNFAEPVERMEDEGEGITYLIADPLIGEDSGSGDSVMQFRSSGRSSKKNLEVSMDKRQPGLTFDDLRIANYRRLPQFKNKHGDPAHSRPDGSDWNPAQWLQAVIGELGEYANFRKKFERGDLTFEEFAEHAAKELADVQTYLDILARRCLDVDGDPHPTGINLGDATIAKFNEVSDRVKSDSYLDLEDGAVIKPVSLVDEVLSFTPPHAPLEAPSERDFESDAVRPAKLSVSGKSGRPWENKDGLLEGNSGMVVSSLPFGKSKQKVTEVRCVICFGSHEADDCGHPE